VAHQADQTVTVKIKFEADTAGMKRGLNDVSSAANKTAAQVARERHRASQQRTAPLSAADQRRLKSLDADAALAGVFPDAYGPEQARERRALRARQSAARHHDNLARAGFRDSIIGDLDAQRDAGEQARAAREARLKQQRQARADVMEARRKAHDEPMRGTARWYDQQAISKEAGYLDQQQMAREMHARGVNPDGSPMIGLDRFLSQPAGARTRLDAARAFGGRLMGRAALPLAALYAGKRAADATIAADQAAATPYMRAGAIDEAQSGAVPILGDIRRSITGVRRARSGENMDVKQQIELRDDQLMRAQLTGQANVFGAGLRQNAAAAANRADALSGLRLDRLPAGINRNAVGGMRQYEEALRLLPLQQRLTVAAKERAAAEKTFAQTQETEKKRLAELAEIDKRLAQARAKRQGAAGVYSREEGALSGYESASRAEAVLNEQRKAAAAAAEQATGARKEAEQGAVGARAGERAAAADKARGELGVAEGRESAARQGARTLGGLGRAGRQEALVALRMVKRLGVDNVDPETVALAEQVDPETVGAMKEKAGEKAKGAFRKVSPDSPAFADLGEATRRTDAAREKVTRLDEGGLSAEARDRADAAARGIVEEIIRRFQQIEVELKQERANRERAAGNGAAA